MPIRRVAAALCLFTTALLVASCGGVIDPSKNTVDEFPGTLAVGGSKQHEFTAAKNGEFEIKITALAPNQDALLGLNYGLIQNGVCTTQQQNFYAQLNRVALGGLMNSGRYCVTIYDVGTLSQPETYTIRVSHP